MEITNNAVGHPRLDGCMNLGAGWDPILACFTQLCRSRLLEVMVGMDFFRCLLAHSRLASVQRGSTLPMMMSATSRAAPNLIPLRKSWCLGWTKP
jgi:hypothetical protein